MESGKMPPEEVERLRTILGQLREELERTRVADETTQAKLDMLSAQLDTLLEEEAPPTAEAHRSLGSRLTDALAHLGEDHPALAYSIGQVIETLSGLGI
jgi:hypothetical protein